MVAPVALVRFDEMAREDLAGAEGDDGDLPFVDDGQDTATGLSRTDLEVIEPPAASQRQGALLVGDVIAKAEVPAAGRVGWDSLRRCPVCLTRCRTTNCSVGSCDFNPERIAYVPPCPSTP